MEKTTLLDHVHTLLRKDQATLWHPYTQARTADQPLLIKEAFEASLYTEEGKEILDAISSWWVTLHGHRHPHIAQAITKQLSVLEHVMFADFTHQPAIELAEKLLELLPSSFSRVFYSDNGSTAVETAIKIAFQYWYNQDPKTERKQVIALRGGYHGDTFGAMAVSSPDLFTQPFQHALFDVAFIDPPKKGNEEATYVQLQAILNKQHVACFIFEPVIQGAAGMHVHASEGLNTCLEMCHDAGVITIADEVMTGFGRTGPLFALEKLEQTPDIVCLAKGLTGGFLPLGATICQEELFQQFVAEERTKALLHGHSYCGNPLGCAAGIASLELLKSETCEEQRKAIEQSHRTFYKRWKDHPKVSHMHVTGTILGIEYATKGKITYFDKKRDALFNHFRSRDILIRPLGNTIHVLPPYCITEKQLNRIYAAIEETFEKEEL